MSPEARRYFHEELQDLEDMVQAMGAASGNLLAKALEAMSTSDSDLCNWVIAHDDEIDEYYVRVEQKILDLFALQAPVASDLRLLTALLHINLHLERIGDMAVNIAKIVKLTANLPRSQGASQTLGEMGEVSLRMVAAALDAFKKRDVEACLRLPGMDDSIDRLNRGMLGEVLAMADDLPMLEWGIRMHVVSRQIERVGDHAVDIGEQAHFLVTGEFKEFTDASHPETQHAEGKDE